MRSGCALGVDVLRHAGVAGAAAAEEAGELGRDAAAAGVQHRRLVEVDRQVCVLVAVGERALRVGPLAAQDRAAHEELRRRFDVTPLVIA